MAANPLTCPNRGGWAHGDSGPAVLVGLWISCHAVVSRRSAVRMGRLQKIFGNVLALSDIKEVLWCFGDKIRRARISRFLTAPIGRSDGDRGRTMSTCRDRKSTRLNSSHL